MIRALPVMALLLASTAAAQRARDADAPLPYSEQQDEDARTRKIDQPRPITREETENERLEREKSLASLDDPNVGISIEGILGAMFLESSRGQGVEPRFAGGARLTWEWSRTVFTDEFWREAFFVDASWWAVNWSDGTKDVYDSTHYHYFTVAPAWALQFGKLPISAYAQVGFGAAFTTSSLFVTQAQTDISGTKFLFQYGLGIRFRPAIVDDGKVRISFRVELTRFLRGYMDDTYFGGSLGVTF